MCIYIVEDRVNSQEWQTILYLFKKIFFPIFYYRIEDCPIACITMTRFANKPKTGRAAENEYTRTCITSARVTYEL